MNNQLIINILPKLNDIAKFFKFRRSKIKKNIIKTLEKLDDDIENLLNITWEKDKKIGILSNIIQEKSNEINNLTNKSHEKDNKIEKLEKENSSINEKFDLVSNVLSVKPNINIGLVKFKNLLYSDFLNFANTEKSLAEEADAILQMQSIEKELELVTGFSKIYSKNIIGIGGGYNAGKSEFISSFFKEEIIKLPIGIKPATVIPTYVIAGEENIIKGYSNNGGSINIKPELYEKLSHDFVKTFNFNLKNIMPFMALSTPLKEDYFYNICLVDTPGYNPSDNGALTNEDKKTAIEYLRQANCIIWIISIEIHGTIPDDDLKFLCGLNESTDNKLYLVLSHAELRCKSDQDKILENVSEILNDNYLDFEGISVFDSKLKKEYNYQKLSLYDFLRNENNPQIIKNKIIENLDVIFEMYEKSINKNITEINDGIYELNSIELDLMQSGFEPPDNNNTYDKLDRIKQAYNINELNKLLLELKSIKKNMHEAIEDIFYELKNQENI